MVRWGIVGAGGIAKRFAGELPHSEFGTLVAVGSRDLSKAESWLDSIDLGTSTVRAHGSYDELFADPQVDAVYIATPHQTHAELVAQAAAAGKHILCEKPVGVTLAQTQQEIDAARAADVYFAEAFMHRFHPQFARMRELIAEGAIGELQHVETTFAFRGDLAPTHRLANPELAGGGLLDLGCYTASGALAAGAAAEAGDWSMTRAVATLGSTGVDEWAVAGLTFESGATAHLVCGTKIALQSHITAWGSAGRMHLEDPWTPAPGEPVSFELSRVSTGTETITVPGVYQYALEADAVEHYLAERQPPQISWSDTLQIAAVLDEWRSRIGLRYPFE